MRAWILIALPLAAALPLPGPALAVPATDAQKCEAAFELASGKLAQCRLNAESKFTRTNDDAKLATALARCSAKLSDALDRAVAKYGAGDCTAESPLAFDAYLTQCSDDVEAASGVGGGLPGSGGGGLLTNGGTHTGAIFPGALEVWTFTATAGERIALHAGEIGEIDDFRPWIRLLAPDGSTLSSTSGLAAAAVDGVVAPVTGVHLVLLASFDSGFDGAGTYRLTAARTQGAVTVSDEDQGGALDVGVLHSGEILRGDLDVWTLSPIAGQQIDVHIDQVAETDDFRPWIRLWAPNGSTLASMSGLDAADITGIIAPVTGTYLVLVASFDSGFDGTGSYELTATVTP
jgi:hypothetical protein